MQYSTATHDGFCKILFPVTDLHWILWVRHRIYLTRILDYLLTRFGYCCDDVFQPLELLLYLEPHCSLFLKKGSAIACFLSITLHSVPPESTKSHSHLTRLSWDWPFYKGYLPFTDEIRSQTHRTQDTGIPVNIPQSESKIKEYAVSCEWNERTQLYRYSTVAHTRKCVCAWTFT